MSAAIWLAAARPKTLPAAIVPVIVGTACAHAVGGVAWGPATAALAGALAIQIGTNFANDVFDAERGTDGPDRVGPLRAVSAGLISAARMKRAMIAAFATATAFGAYLAWIAGWPVIAIGTASVIAGIAYTGGPWPLGYHGLGDVFVLGFFGLVAVCGTVFVQVAHVPALAVWASLPVGALATAILVVNNLRDRVGDARSGKRTLAVRFGRNAAIAEYAALLAVAMIVPIGVAIATGRPTIALPALTAPLAWERLRRLVRASRDGASRRTLTSEIAGAELNALLASTAQLMLAHGALFAVGLVMA